MFNSRGEVVKSLFEDLGRWLKQIKRWFERKTREAFMGNKNDWINLNSLKKIAKTIYF